MGMFDWKNWFNNPEPEVATPIAPVIQSPDLYSGVVEAMIEGAKRDIGQTETDGPNRSPLIDACNKICGAPMGSAYCTSALWVRSIQYACDKLSLINPVQKTAGSQKFRQNVPAQYRVPLGVKAKAGYFGSMQDRDNPLEGHLFLVTEDSTDDKICRTAEYNTDAAGSRDGEGFYLRFRTTDGTKGLKFFCYLDIASWIVDANATHVKVVAPQPLPSSSKT